MSLRQLDKETQIALRYYMADMGCLASQGKFFQWWEVDMKEWVAIPAKISTEGFLTQKNIIRRHDRVYVEGHNESWAIRNAANMYQQTFTFTGKLIDLSPIESGRSQSGKDWKRRVFAIQEEGQYPNTIAFTIQGDKCETTDLQQGRYYTVDFQVQSRKPSDRYFTEAKVIAVKMIK
jgi:hypothetical protein